MINKLSRTNRKQLELGGCILDINDNIYIPVKHCIDDEEVYGLVNLKTCEIRHLQYKSIEELNNNVIFESDIIFNKNEIAIIYNKEN